MKIYTRGGDHGTTGLASGERVSKTDPRVEACGAVDELNCALGASLAHGASPDTAEILRRIQHDLFALGAELAAPSAPAIVRLSATHTAQLEADIDRLTALLPPLRHFILPGGCPPAAHLHLARAVCRRAERRTVALASVESVAPHALSYLNRLSDLLFTLARFENHRQGATEEKWIPAR